MSEKNRQLRLSSEAALAMAERTIRRMFILLLVVVIMWGLSMGAFIWYLNLYDYEAYEITQDSNGVNFVGGSWLGVEVNNGTDSQSTQTHP